MPEEFRISLVDPADSGLVEQLGGAIKEALAQEGKGKWVGTSGAWLGGKAVVAIEDAIQGIDLMTVFGSAWTTAISLRERANPDKYPWDKTQYVKLGEHTVKFGVSPKIVVSVAGWNSRPIELAMELSAIINAMELKILSGHIASICGGSCDLGVRLSSAASRS